MKLTNANSVIFLSGILFFFACSYQDEKALYSGNWKYISVQRNDSSVIEIEDSDFFQLNTDSSFEYHLTSVNKHMYGKWSVDRYVLTLKYTKPDTVRNFEIDVISKYHLQFHEGNTYFDFKRTDPN